MCPLVSGRFYFGSRGVRDVDLCVSVSVRLGSLTGGRVKYCCPKGARGLRGTAYGSRCVCLPTPTQSGRVERVLRGVGVRVVTTRTKWFLCLLHLLSKVSDARRWSAWVSDGRVDTGEDVQTTRGGRVVRVRSDDQEGGEQVLGAEGAGTVRGVTGRDPKVNESSYRISVETEETLGYWTFETVEREVLCRS